MSNWHKHFTIFIIFSIVLLVSFLGAANWRIDENDYDKETPSRTVINSEHRQIHRGKVFHFGEIAALTTTEEAQAITLTPANVGDGDQFIVTVNGVSITTTISDATPTVAEAVTSIVLDLGNIIPEFVDITWSDDTTNISGISVNAGRGFEVSLTTVDGNGNNDQTFVLATTQVNIPDKLEYLMTMSSTKKVHLNFFVTGTLVTTVKVFRDCERTGGIDQASSIFNRHGDSTETPTCTFTSYPAGSGNGTQIHIDKWGISTGQGANATLGGGQNRDTQEWVLEASGAYLIVIEGISDADDVTAHFNWYETDAGL